MENAYAILGLSQEATEEEIKTAYRRLVKLYHPDLNPNNTHAAEKFKEITHAYEVIIQLQKIAPSSPSYNFKTEDLLNNIFKNSASSFYRKNQELAYILKISFLEACHGVAKKIILTGTPDQKSLDIHIPAGIAHNQQLRLSDTSHGHNRDIVLTVQVADHPLFVRDGLDIILGYPLTVPEYIRGGVFQIPTIHGPASVNIPPLAPLQSPCRLAGKGIHMADGSQGDGIVHLEVIYPPMNDELGRLLHLWETTFPENPRKKLEKIL